jgi:hypothetical protein
VAAFALAAPAGASAKSPADLAPSVAEAQEATAACANHDACYAAQQGQLKCDNWFRNDMYAHCATRPWYQRGLCRSTANVYYDAVRRFGHLFYG